jgi:hypothetical protein
VVAFVVDQQPALPLTQLVKQHPDLLVQAWQLGQAQPPGERRELAWDGGRLLRGKPPHQLVVAGVAVGVLDRQLGLADPAQPMHRAGLHDHAGRGLGELAAQGLEQVAPAGEMQVA